MHASQYMDDFVAKLLQQFLPNLPETAIHLTLTMSGHGQLVISEVIPGVQVCIGRATPRPPKPLVYDPLIYFWIADGAWIPYAISRGVMKWQGFAQFNPLTNSLEYVDTGGQLKLTTLVDDLVGTWESQGWLEHAHVNDQPATLP